MNIATLLVDGEHGWIDFAQRSADLSKNSRANLRRDFKYREKRERGLVWIDHSPWMWYRSVIYSRLAAVLLPQPLSLSVEAALFIWLNEK